MEKHAKVLASLQRMVDEGQYYEAHQRYRTTATRALKGKDGDGAIQVLFAGSTALLKTGREQLHSAVDLALYMVEASVQNETPVDRESRARVTQIVSMISIDTTTKETRKVSEALRKKLMDRAIDWTRKTGGGPGGDSELHHAFGLVFQREHNYLMAERHFLQGLEPSAEALGEMLYTWSLEDDRKRRASYAARAVFGYLLAEQIKLARLSLTTFLHLVTTREPEALASPSEMVFRPVSKGGAEAGSAIVYLFKEARLPLLDFLQCLILTIQYESRMQFQQLCRYYQSQISNQSTEVVTNPQNDQSPLSILTAASDSGRQPQRRFENGWQEPMEAIAEMYFDLRPPSSSNVNPMAQMMQSMLGLGPAAGPASTAAKSSGARARGSAQRKIEASGLD